MTKLNATRVTLFTSHNDGTMSISSIFEIHAPACEALSYLRGWIGGDATHFSIQRGYRSGQDTVYPFPSVGRTDNLTPIGRYFSP